MKKHLVFSSILLLVFRFISYGQSTQVPDANFENYLETHADNGAIVNIGDATSMGDGIANNGFVLTSRINNVISLNVSSLSVLDLAGIEDFTVLETLICSSNKLTTLNVSSNTNLKTLLCGSNLLTSLSLSSNTSLDTLNCSDNQIQNLNLTNNTLIKSLSCSGNQLSQLDISNNSDLTFLSVSNNQLSDLIVSNNPNLESLFCASNQISILNLSNNAVLKTIDVSKNLIANLNLSAINTVVCPNPQTDPLTICQGIASINVSSNQLVSLIINNGYNDLISTFNSEDNSDLFCIQTDSGFIPPTNWIKDDWTYYSETTCTDIYTYIPDDNFEQALIDAGYDSVLDNFVLTSNINTITNLNISSKSISSLTGIEDFAVLEILDCSTNQMDNLDIINNTALLQINCSSNNLSSLDLSANVLITTLDCSSNSLLSLSLNNNTLLTSLNCSNNVLTNLSLQNNILINDLDCSLNLIETLNIALNTTLTSLSCNDNNLFSLNIKNGNNNLITTFNATNNANLFCIEVDNVANANAAAGWQKDVSASYNIGCGTYVPDDNFEQALIDLGIDSDNTLNNFVATADINTITTLDISSLGILDLTGIEDFAVLQNLNCSNNSIASLDLSTNLSLSILDCSANQIKDLDFILNTALTSLICNNNALISLDIKNGNNNLLATFNTTNNLNLFCINVDDAIIGSIPGSWLKDTFASYNGDCNGARFTAIPDNNFEQVLVDLGFDAIPNNNRVLTSNIEHVLNLNVNNKQIGDLTGIQDFKSLVSLDCSTNYLNTLDVSGMVNLEELNCNSNYLLTNNIANPNGLLNLTGTISLTKLFCASNNLSNLDMSLNTNLETLDCADNNLDVLDIAGNTQLKILNSSNNNLTNLDISNNTILEEVNCNSNQISSFINFAINNSTLQILSCNNNAISSLPVNRCLALTTLNCRSNNLSQLNLNSNTLLEILDFSNNNIADINLTNNTNLKEVLASQNQLTQLNTISNTILENLNCDYNQINQLLLNSASLLKYLSCSTNQLTDLDLSNNNNLIEANFSSNSILNLIIPNNLNALKTFNASSNQILGDIDLSTMGISSCLANDNSCPDTITINVSNNQLKFVNIQNGINNEILNFSATNNPNLTCIQVDDVNNIGTNWQKDATATYSIDCRFGETYVPDDSFEQALINLGYDSGTLDDYVLTTNIDVLTVLDVSGNSILDLTGIQDFIALQNLNISSNTLSTVNLSLNVNLIEINCSTNSFSDLDFTKNIALTTINCSNNNLTSLDLTSNANITSLNIANNLFTEFDPNIILSLQIFNCDFNQITELDFQGNTALTSLSCQSNILELLNIKNGQNSNLTNLNAQNNSNLTCIETDTGTVPNGVTWLKDATTQYAINCFYGEVYVPDDNFEQTLIDLGYDSGPLDDYVLSDNIDGISYLDISNKDISDLTGIEEFLSLTTLNFEGNTITNVDLSNNILLVDLDASSNAIAVIDLSFNSNLTALNVSNNSLSQLNLDSNLNLLKLNVSNNSLSILNVNLLVNLTELDCSSNLLSALNVTTNPNLIKLYCQSNLFISDQLNIKNGTNQNLQIFNATNNLDLRCILVDDPFTVITNAAGTYDNWSKDDSANYQTICEDADNDGVANTNDQCPNTPFGNTVDLFGCSVINLPNNNFTILITGETCLNSNNGKINITTIDYYNYTATLTGDNFLKDYHFTNNIDILNLLAGTYQMCITINEWPNYINCYNIVISQPEPLGVLTSKSSNGKNVSISMSGSSSYNIDFNGLKFNTTNSSVTLALQNGTNNIKISTNLDCQGVYEEKILVSNKIFVYPNPFQEKINIYLGDINEENITINMYSYLGQLVYSKTVINPKPNKINIDTSTLATGIYTISIQTNTSLATFKIIKK